MMNSIPDYMADAEGNTRDTHGLEVGDVVESAWGDATVEEVTDVGVRFDNGEVADHLTVACNLNDYERNNA